MGAETMGKTEKLSDAQWGFLRSIEDFGPRTAIEVIGPPKMDGSRRIKLENCAVSAATLDNLRRRGLVHIERGEVKRPVNAVGKKGNTRTQIAISLTDAGRAAIFVPDHLTPTQSDKESGDV